MRLFISLLFSISVTASFAKIKAVKDTTNFDSIRNYEYELEGLSNNIINGEDDVTIINDFIYTLRYILLGLLVFE